MLNAVLYARYSSDNQREESIAAQIRAGREYCKKKGYTIIREYKDEAYTGTNDHRPAFQQMLTDARNKLFDVVVFHKVDRHSRNEFDYYYSKLQLKKHGVKIEYVAQQIDDSPEGAMMEAMLVGMAAYYSRNLSKEILKGKRENAYKGLFNGGKPPLGYKIINKRYVINEDEARAVRLIFELYLKNYGYVAIIDELYQQGFKTRTGRPFSKSGLYEILRNPRYIGIYTLGKIRPNAEGKRNTHGKPSSDVLIIEDILPAIISKKDFYKVAEKMERNKRTSAAYSAKYNYLLSGFVYCSECGALMQGKTTTLRNPDRQYQYYYCGSKNRQGKSACANGLISLEQLESIVIKKLNDTIFAPAARKNLVDNLTKSYQKRVTNIEKERTALQKEKQKTERRLDMLYTQIEEGLADEYDLTRLKKVKQEMNVIKTKLTELSERPDAYLTEEEIEAALSSYQDAINNKSADNLRALIENFIQKITVSNDEIIITFKINLFCTYGAVDGT